MSDKVQATRHPEITLSDWQPDPKPVVPELDPDYVHATYPPEPVKFADWVTQLEQAQMATLISYHRGGIGQPETD